MLILFPYFWRMLKTETGSAIVIKTWDIESILLQRQVTIHVYLPHHWRAIKEIPLLLINDGQNMKDIKFDVLLSKLYLSNVIAPICCVAIEAGADRKLEYGVAGVPDYLGRGAKAKSYCGFIMNELLPYLQATYPGITFSSKSFAGFSLGGLSALDIAWHYEGEFEKVGVFSGSLWWRSLDHQDPDYDDDKHRIMQQQIRKGNYQRGLKFFFQCGAMDESEDRNNNGIIDSIDDTLDLVKELEQKGYVQPADIFYYEMADGKHDMPTWAQAMPVFLEWGWGQNKNISK